MAFIWQPWTDAGTVVNSGTLTGAAILLALIVLQALLLPKCRPAAPIILLILHVLMLGLKWLTEDESNLRTVFGVSALLFLLLGISRSGFVLVFHGLLHFLRHDLPKIALDILQTLFYLLAIIITLAAAGVEPISLLTGSAVLTAVLGLALKDTLGNLFAGMAIQAQRPFDIDDWIQFDDNPSHIGKVREINWRATTVVTLDDVEVVVPNAMLGSGRISNFTKPLPYSRRSVYVNAPYSVPPRQVHEIILSAIRDAWGVLAEPAPSVVTNGFDDRGVQYWIRFFTEEFDFRDRVDGGVRDCVWYALNRAGIAIPGPLRIVTMRPNESSPRAEEAPAGRRERSLRSLPIFTDLSDDDIHRLALLSHTRLYAPQEVIVRQGDVGEELFVVLKGQVSVSATHDGTSKVELSKIGPGEIFGEMAMLTGARRTATVQAIEECELLAIGASAFRQLLAASDDLAARVHSLHIERKANLDTQLDKAAAQAAEAVTPRNFLVRFLEQLLESPNPSR